MYLAANPVCHHFRYCYKNHHTHVADSAVYFREEHNLHMYMYYICVEKVIFLYICTRNNIK
jgi:hypothetical protein